MKKLIIPFLLFFTSVSYACEPCMKTLNFKESVAKADLIIIGQKINEGPLTSIGGEDCCPPWIEVKVKQILYGEEQDKEIRVHSWSGMCGYGIVVNDDKDYVMILKKQEVSGGQYLYDTVNYGCGVKQYLIEGNFVNFDGEKFSLIDFVKKLNDSRFSGDR